MPSRAVGVSDILNFASTIKYHIKKLPKKFQKPTREMVIYTIQEKDVIVKKKLRRRRKRHTKKRKQKKATGQEPKVQPTA